MSNAVVGYGTSLTWNGATVSSLKTINGIELSVNAIDVTSHQSPSAFKESIPGLLDSGDVSVDGFFDYTDTAGQQAMLTDMVSRTTRIGIITFPAATGATWTFSAFISKLKIGDAPVDGAIPFSATLNVTGKPTFAVATSAGLTGLTFSNSGVIEPAFAQATTDYVVTFATGITNFVVTPTASAGVITITANGASQTVTSGAAASAITLGAAASIIPMTITVAETNKAPKTYTLRALRA
jgi:predicted secreted protein